VNIDERKQLIEVLVSRRYGPFGGEPGRSLFQDALAEQSLEVLRAMCRIYIDERKQLIEVLVSRRYGPFGGEPRRSLFQDALAEQSLEVLRAMCRISAGAPQELENLPGRLTEEEIIARAERKSP
jgi:hypothetical protein